MLEMMWVSLGGGREGGRRWFGLGYILKVLLVSFFMDWMWVEREREVLRMILSFVV